jgi:hypothetical protein
MTHPFPSEVIDLPSKGWFYPAENPLSKGQLEMKYMTAREEDILTSRTLIQKGIVIDKLMQSLILDGVNYDDLLIGDKNGLMVAARIMGYGKDYEVSIQCPVCEKTQEVTINLEQITEKKLEFDLQQKGKNEFFFTLPASHISLTFKLLTHRDEREVQQMLDGLRKISGNVLPEITTRMKKSILALDGNSDRKTISEFVDNMPVRDSTAFREYVRHVSPNVDLSFDFVCSNDDCEHTDRLEVPIDINFFWPHARI